MKTLLRFAGLFVYIFLTSCYADENYSVSEVSAGIFYHQGTHEDPTEANIGAIANVGFIIGERCVAIIDSGGSYLEGTYLRRAVRMHTDLPICYVINSHVHPDHMLGNAAFKADSPQFIGHEKLPAAIAARQDYFAKTFKETLGKAYLGTEFISPTLIVSIDQPITIDLGNRLLTLTAYSTSHTDNDLTVLDNTTKTLWTGDLLFMSRIPALDGSINGWLTTMTKLQSMDLDFVIPGHGKAGSKEWQQGLLAQIKYFTVLRNEIREIISNMGTIEEATQTVGLQEANNWELFQLYHRRNITSSFVELEWE